MKLFKGLDIDKFTEMVMSDPRWEEIEDIDNDLKQYIAISYARGFNNAYEIMGKRFLIGMFIGAILCAVGSAIIGESIKSRKK